MVKVADNVCTHPFSPLECICLGTTQVLWQPTEVSFFLPCRKGPDGSSHSFLESPWTEGSILYIYLLELWSLRPATYQFPESKPISDSILFHTAWVRSIVVRHNRRHTYSFAINFNQSSMSISAAISSRAKKYCQVKSAPRRDSEFHFSYIY